MVVPGGRSIPRHEKVNLNLDQIDRSSHSVMVPKGGWILTEEEMELRIT